MNTKQFYRIKLIFLACILFFTAVFELSGCALTNKISAFLEEKDQYHTNLEELKKALNAFNRFEFKTAFQIYTDLSVHAKDKGISRKAFYGLACTRLILAEHIKDFDEAIIAWNIWNRLYNKELGYEDPRMLSPYLLDTITPKKDNNNTKTTKTAAPHRKLLRAKDNEIKRLKSRLTTMKKEVQTLNNQIESLEAIHQKIQEKKKEISSKPVMPDKE